MVARIKIMCDLDISEKRKPQEARSNSEIRPSNRIARGDDPFAGGVEDGVMRILAAGEPFRSTSWACRPRPAEAQET